MFSVSILSITPNPYVFLFSLFAPPSPPERHHLWKGRMASLQPFLLPTFPTNSFSYLLDVLVSVSLPFFFLFPLPFFFLVVSFFPCFGLLDLGVFAACRLWQVIYTSPPFLPSPPSSVMLLAIYCLSLSG